MWIASVSVQPPLLEERAVITAPHPEHLANAIPRYCRAVPGATGRWDAEWSEDDPELASHLRIEERGREAGALN
jgi:hypothetical protein